MIDLQVNGATHHVRDDESTPLLAVLRESLGLSGPRFGCGQGECGACMVLVDGRPETACTVSVGAVRNRSIETVEGLGTPERPHPVQRAVIEERAGQCGYCLSGIITSAVALLRQHENPSRDQIIDALEPHLCRCGAHPRIIRAVERAAAYIRMPQP